MYGTTVLSSLVISGVMSEEQKLIALKHFVHLADVNICNDRGGTILLSSLFNGMSKISLFLLENTNIDVNKVNQEGQAALHAIIAAKNELFEETSKLDIFKILIENYNANPFLINNFGETILHLCAYFSELEIISSRNKKI